MKIIPPEIYNHSQVANIQKTEEGRNRFKKSPSVTFLCPLNENVSVIKGLAKSELVTIACPPNAVTGEY